MIGLGVDADQHLAASPEEPEREQESPRRWADRRLAAVDLELETVLDQRADACHDSPCRAFGPHIDHEIVGVADETVPTLLQLPVEVIQVDVGKQRAERRPLRGPLPARLPNPVDHDPGIQIEPDQSQHLLVMHPHSDPGHQPVVTNPIEEPIEVDIDRPPQPVGDVRASATHRLMGRAPRTKTKTTPRETRIEDRPKRLRNSLLGTELDPLKTGTNGVLTVNDLQEGLWYWQVSAAGHSTQAGSVEIIPDQTVNVETRLVKSVVTVNFSVVPVPFTDRYEIVIEQTFETHVPAPVLVLTPTYQEFSDVEPGFNTRFTLTAKNHGLIRLEDVTIEGQSFDWGSTTPLIEYLPSLEPFQEVQIPVKVEFWGDEGVSGQSERNSSYSSCVGDMFSAIDNFVDNLFNLIDQLNGRYNCVNSLDFLRTGSMSSMIIREALEQVLDSDYVTSSDMMKVAVMIGCAFADNGGGGDGGGGGGGGGTSYGGSAPACFDPSTRVLLASGETVIIDTLAVGDRIKSGLEDHETAEVAEVVRGTASHWVRIWFDDDPNDDLLVTAEHLIWVDGDGKGWTAAQNLSVGDRVVTSSGARVKVAKLEEIQEDRPLVTVRLNGDIALFANGVLVHDQCGWWAPAKTTEEELEVAP